MSRFCFCNCPAGFEAEPERHAPDCPGRSGAGKRGPTPVPATFKSCGEPKPYPDRLCHIDYTAHPYRCGCLSGDDEAQRRFDEYQRDTKLAKAEGEVVRLTAENAALQQRLTVADQRVDELETVRTSIVGKVTQCKACGSDDLFWYGHIKNHSNVQHNRLNTNDVTCLLVLGCNNCSETLMTVSADKLAERMTAALNPTSEAASHEL